MTTTKREKNLFITKLLTIIFPAHSGDKTNINTIIPGKHKPPSKTAFLFSSLCHVPPPFVHRFTGEGMMKYKEYCRDGYRGTRYYLSVVCQKKKAKSLF
jgi:hypothetical protein